MATKKVTVTLEDEQLAAIQKLVEAGQAESVSSFVKTAVSVSLDDDADWVEALGGELPETSEPLAPGERAWADAILKPAARRRKRPAAAVGSRWLREA